MAVAASLRIMPAWQPQASLIGNVISWNLGPLFLSDAIPYIARTRTMNKGAAAVVILQEVLVQVRRK